MQNASRFCFSAELRALQQGALLGGPQRVGLDVLGLHSAGLSVERRPLWRQPASCCPQLHNPKCKDASGNMLGNNPTVSLLQRLHHGPQGEHQTPPASHPSEARTGVLSHTGPAEIH